MGGNALRNTTVTRLNKADYVRVADSVVAVLRSAIPAAKITVIPSYGAKSDFGDLDVLVSSNQVQAVGGGEFLQKLATNQFHATDMYKNGSVLSFDYRSSPDQTTPGFQVDIIQQEENTYDYALGYFSFNDLGNLIGRTAHKAGLAHRHDGLYYYYREGTNLVSDICLTADYDEAISFLGYDPKVFHSGFQSLEDIFRYVAGSTFFNSDIFLLENRNATSRIRDRKRKTYMEFLNWCSLNPDLPKFVYPETKKEWFPRIKEHFPHFSGEYAKIEAAVAVSRVIKEKYNGEYVSQLTNMTGKELGMLMRKIKDSFESHTDLQSFVLSEDKTTLDNRILQTSVVLRDELSKLPVGEA